MSDIVDIIHRFSYEVQGQQSLSQVQQILQQQVQTITQNTASLKRLETALANTTNPQLQQRIQQAIQNRRNAIATENQAITEMLRNDKTLQGALRAEIGIINELTGRMNQLRQARDRATNVSDLAKYNRQISDIERQQGQLMKRGLNGGGSVLGGIGTALGQGLGVGVGLGVFNTLASGVSYMKEFTTESFKAAANFDQLKVAFSTMLQSEPKANKLLQDIVSFASNTPYGVEQLTELSKQLLAYGFQAEEIIPTLDMLGNVAAGVGKDKMPQIILAFGQIRAAGKLAGQDLLQLINAGFNPLQVISEKTGESMTSLKEKMEDGAISFQMVKDAFRSATTEGGKFFNLMQRQTNTVAGQMDRLEDSVQQLKVAFGALLQDTGADLISMFSGIVESVTELIKLNPAEEIRKEQESFNGLIFALKSANDDEQLRSSIISEITQKYPEFLRLVDLEKASNEELSQAVAEVNRQYQQKINLAALSARNDQLAARGTEIQSEYIDYLIKVGRTLARDGVIQDASQLAAMSDQEIDKFSRDLPNSVIESLNRFKELRRENQKEREENQRILQAEESRQKAADAATLKAAKDKLEILKKQGATQAEIMAQERFIAGLEFVEPVSKTPPSGPTTSKTKAGSKPKTADQIADEAYKRTVATIETQVGNQRKIDKRLRDLRALQVRNEQAYTAYVNSQEFQTDSKEQRAGRQNAYSSLSQVLSSQVQKVNLTYDIAEVALKIDAATKLKREPELIALVEQLAQKEIDLSKVRVEIPVDFKIDAKPLGQDVFDRINKLYFDKLKEEQDKEARIIQERKDAYADMYNSILSNASMAIDAIYSRQIRAYDAEIAYRQYTIQRAQDLALRGNTEVLQQEEDALRRATAAREEAAQRQLQLNATLQASNMAVAVSEAIGAVIKIASGGDPYTAAARIIAAVAAIVGGVTALSTAFSSVNTPGYKDGVIGLKGPGTTKSDSIPAFLSKNESVMKAEATDMYGPYLERMNALDFNIADYMPAPVVYVPKAPKNVPNSQSNPSQRDFNMLGKKLDIVAEAVSNLQINANQRMDKNGLVQTIEVYQQGEKRRFIS